MFSVTTTTAVSGESAASAASLSKSQHQEHLVGNSVPFVVLSIAIVSRGPPSVMGAVTTNCSEATASAATTTSASAVVAAQ